MSECICLITGIMVGGISGVTLMCLLQINRISKRDCSCREENDDA